MEKLETVAQAIKEQTTQQLVESAQMRRERELNSRALDRASITRLWELMTEMYGHKWTSQFGDEIDPNNVWAASLKGIMPEMVKHGLNQCVVLGLAWPPSAPEFRKLCTGEDEVAWEHKRIAAADREQGEQPKRLENLTYRERQRAINKERMRKLREEVGI